MEYLAAFTPETLMQWTLTFLLLSYFILGFDDFVVDLIALIKGVGPRELFPEQLEEMNALKERSIAIMIASWKESGVLSRMVNGNLSRIQYGNYHFFLGVYPNDQATVAEAEELARIHPNVHVVQNLMSGPTSKGQMLNEVVRGILKTEKDLKLEFDAFLMHDSEDLIHPWALKLLNWLLVRNEFIQIPIFSLPTPLRQLVAGTYQDEFAEWHTKDILVRDRCHGGVPSAGTGTALSRHLMLMTLREQNQEFLNQGSLTEDYELGLRSFRRAHSSRFACYYYRDAEGRREYIATRAYFPRKLTAAIRQKTRWTVGIAFQGFQNLGWTSNLRENWFLFRDRKGPISNLLTIAGLILLPLFFLSGTPLTYSEPLVAANLLFMTSRLLHRVYCTARVYGPSVALLAPLRLPVGNLVNACASLRAAHQYSHHLITKAELTWSKTDHELPAGFGAETSRKAG